MKKWLRVAATSLVAVIGLAACKDDDAAPGPPAQGKAYIRHVNAVWQQYYVSNAGTDTVYNYKPVKLDVLIDSSGTAPGVTGQEGNTVSNGTDGTGSYSAGFYTLEPGVHSFVARRGDIPNAPSFFITPTGTSCTNAPAQYLPRQQMTGTTYYTFILAGANPARRVQSVSATNDTTWINVLAAIAGTCNPLMSPNSLSSVEDPFSPPWTSAGGTNYYQARFFFWHVAPFAGTGRPIYSAPAKLPIRLYVTPGGSAAAPTALDLPSLQVWGTANFQAKSAAQNVKAGEYWFTWVAYQSSPSIVFHIIKQEKVTLAPGEVSTFFIFNTLPSSGPGSGGFTYTTPSTSAVTWPDGISTPAQIQSIFKVEKKQMGSYSF